jgi:CheY-like chemotaxis protein
LAISKQLVELHGGSIHAKSMGENKGSTFVVHLPLIMNESGKIVERAHPTTPVTDEAVPVPELNGMTVLVVDDEWDSIDLIRRVLETRGAKVIEAQSAQEALVKLERTTPDVIVSDIGMPDMDGYEFIRRWRAGEARGRKIPALALTAFARPNDRKRAIVAGYQAHLAKPFDLAELTIVIAGLVGRT